MFNGSKRIEPAMKYPSLLAVALTAFTVVGCAKDGQHAQTDVPPGMDAAAANAPSTDSEKMPPIAPNTHFAAGQVAESRGETDAAIRQYREALQLQKDHQPSLYRLGCLYTQLKKYPEAIAAWKHYLKATDESAFAYSNLAFTEELAGDPAKAEADYKKGITNDPANEPCRINYGLMLARHGRIGEATIQLQAVLNPAEVHFNIASVYELQRKKELAKLEYRKALQLDPDLNDAREKLASLDN